MSYLKIENLHVDLETFALHVESLKIQKGSFFGVLGYSGAGKSTLLNFICGLKSAKSGNVFLEDEDITHKKPHQREIAYVFQNSLLFEGLNVKENLEYLLKAKGIKKEKFKEMVDSHLSDCEAIELLNRDITTLSGGERQRVALAMALMFKPKLLILDEPFSNLDASLKVRMRAFLKTLVKTHNITAIMVTHDKEDAFELFDEMMLLESGKVVQVGTPKEIYENPTSIKSAEYFGIENIIYKENRAFITPYSAIHVDKDGEKQRIVQKVFVEGRWKNKLESGLVFYSNESLKVDVNIKIDNSKIKEIKC